MSFRSKLLATAAIPALSLALMGQPARADALTRPVQVAQAGDGQSGDEAQPNRRHRREQQRSGGEEGGRGPAAEKQAEPQAEKPRQQRQKQAEPESARPAEGGEPQQDMRRQKRQQPGMAEPEGGQPQGEKPASQQDMRRQMKHGKQAEPQQPGMDESGAQPSAPAQDSGRPFKQKKRGDQAAPQPDATTQPQAEPGAPGQDADHQTGRKKHPFGQQQKTQPQGEDQPAGQAPKGGAQTAPTPGEAPNGAESTGKPQNGARPTHGDRSKQPGASGQPAQGEAAPGTPNGAEAPGGQQNGARPTHGDRGKQPGTPGQPVQGEAPNAAEAPGNQQNGGRPTRGEQPAQGQAAPGAGEGRQPGDMRKPGPDQQSGGVEGGPNIPPIADKRTTEEKQKIARDPSKTDETVVLPVNNGAAVLDSDKDADNSGGDQSRMERRKLREKQRASEQLGPPPASDAAAQAGFGSGMRAPSRDRIQANLNEKGSRMNEAPAFAMPQPGDFANNRGGNRGGDRITNMKVIDQSDNRVVFDMGDRMFVRSDDRPRLRRDAERSYYDQLPGGRQRETIYRPGGYRVVTIYDRYGDIVQRSRIDRDGREYLMMYAPDDEETPGAAMMDVGDELPPMHLTVPVSDYIIDVANDPNADFYDFLARPPVERVERVYTIDEVRHSARLRDKMRRIDLDTIHFATGSAEVSMSQAKTLRQVADAMQKLLARNPGETFLIEGHTDAVGSDESNLVLSDQRAESVASLLTEVYAIPPENLVTQGYGERFLKIRTDGPEAENRRVTIRRVTPLVSPVAQR